MYKPDITYRIQFHKDFNLTKFEAVIPYLHRLGIKTIYASPIFAAMPGSNHGYDGINPNQINPEIGDWEQFVRISNKLKELGMGWLQDFVPNHMAFSPLNPWIYDVLEKGRYSAFDRFFDKQPDTPLMVPVLGSTLQEALESREITLVIAKSKLQLRHADLDYPLNVHAYVLLLNAAPLNSPLNSLHQQALALTRLDEHADYEHEWRQLLVGFSQALEEQEQAATLLQQLARINEDQDLLRDILDLQFYRLCDWRATATRINYRRFFTVNSLICMNMQDPVVFDHYHDLLLKMVQEDLIQGIRIDHIDGLLDPEGYLNRLRQHAGPDIYICVEKILGHQEEIPAQWPIQGTTGYDFMNQVAQLMTNTTAQDAFNAHYKKLSQETSPVPELVYQYKSRLLNADFQGDLDNLTALFYNLPGLMVPEEINEKEIREVIAALLIYCPVYRFYPGQIPLSGQDLRDFRQLIRSVSEGAHAPVKALDFVSSCFLENSGEEPAGYNASLLYFWRRCMQFSGPLMAKGIEDTFSYNYFPLLAHSEVGSIPGAFGMSITAFHEVMQERLQRQPLTINTTSTHDTKRGEDTRARLLQLSKDPDTWFRQVFALLKPEHRDGLPDANEQYFILQVLYGALPFENQQEFTATFNQRVGEYLQKAAREAKKHSGWEQPDTAYETMLINYADNISNKNNAAVSGIMRDLLNSNTRETVRSSLVQTVLKCTCPGVADIYQGTELWDLSFVDPDNRRAVDFEERALLLERIIRQYPEQYSGSFTDPAIKMFTLWRLLGLRKKYPELFNEGSYESIQTTGPWISYMRRYQEHWLWIVLPLESTLVASSHLPALPGEAPEIWEHIFTGEKFSSSQPSAQDQFKPFPVMVAYASNATGRNAGILLPLSALMGVTDAKTRRAQEFIRFLSQSGQKLWQMLPLNPVSADNCFSPYAATSAFAADSLYIDLSIPENQGWLNAGENLSYSLSDTGGIDYARTKAGRETLLRQAWQAFKHNATVSQQNEFTDFCAATSWLEDYALYAVLKTKHQQKPWYDWPEPYRLRDRDTLLTILSGEQEEIKFEQWKQFIFRQQWKALRRYAAQHNVKLLGDVPFYMGADSADVWANQHLFHLDAGGRPEQVAGVPPDYFSETGQLWGMPTYNWEAMEQEGYSWWLERLKDNVALFDLIRLDHFRAFYDYWEVPAREQTALNGKWKQGPQRRFFDLLQLHFPTMPFLAEDLGEIHEGVTGFKDQYSLPGMYVLQFGFDQYDARIHHLPHNFSKRGFVYTGTHDNNTIRGWFRELGAAAKDALAAYIVADVEEKTIADHMVRMAYASVAETVIIPVQDLLNMDERSRINTPATTTGNWTWCLPARKLNEELTGRLLRLVKRYNR